jgi:8-oxo-dGTP pyrophosphatase MutT (NUDIX family)
MRRSARELAEPLSRWQADAHFTGSAVVVDAAGERVCLVHHRKLGRWLQPGGHHEAADDGDVAATALREASEETGLVLRLHQRAPRPLDVDVHVFPARDGVAEHLHLDLRFLLVAQDATELAPQAGETLAAEWLGFDEALARVDEQPLRRALHKARAAVR